MAESKQSKRVRAKRLARLKFLQSLRTAKRALNELENPAPVYDGRGRKKKRVKMRHLKVESCYKHDSNDDSSL